MPPNRTRVLIAHPSADRYGSDLQLLETVTALVEVGSEVTVAVPTDGPLVEMLRARGADVRLQPVPVLRKSALSPFGLVRLVVDLARCFPQLLALVRESGSDAVIVNTITVPWWLAAGRLLRRRTVCHVHEAEQDGSRAVRTALALPNLLAKHLVVNSAAAASALTSVVPWLKHRITVVHNGVPGPTVEPDPPRERAVGDPATIAVVARLSPRKGIDVALDAVGLLASRGHDVRIVVCGSTFTGYEWYEQDLRARAGEPDLAGRVEFRGYVSPTWPVLAAADVVVVPSRVEPFGNTAVEALLARRPLVASRTQGLAEIVRPGINGLGVEPDDPAALADAIEQLLNDPWLARRLAEAGRGDALVRFSTDAYSRAIVKASIPQAVGRLR